MRAAPRSRATPPVMLASARCTSVAGFTAMTRSPTAPSAVAAFPFLVGLVTEPFSFRHCTTKGAGRRLSACSNVAACCGSSRASIFFSPTLRTHWSLGGCGAHRGHAELHSALDAFASPLSRGTNCCTPSGRSNREVNHARRLNVAWLRSLRRVTKSPSGQSLASTSGRGTRARMMATAAAHPPDFAPSVPASRGTASFAASLRSLREQSTFIHWPSV